MNRAAPTSSISYSSNTKASRMACHPDDHDDYNEEEDEIDEEPWTLWQWEPVDGSDHDNNHHEWILEHSGGDNHPNNSNNDNEDSEQHLVVNSLHEPQLNAAACHHHNTTLQDSSSLSSSSSRNGITILSSVPSSVPNTTLHNGPSSANASRLSLDPESLDSSQLLQIIPPHDSSESLRSHNNHLGPWQHSPPQILSHNPHETTTTTSLSSSLTMSSHRTTDAAVAAETLFSPASGGLLTCSSIMDASMSSRSSISLVDSSSSASCVSSSSSESSLSASSSSSSTRSGDNLRGDGVAHSSLSFLRDHDQQQHTRTQQEEEYAVGTLVPATSTPKRLVVEDDVAQVTGLGSNPPQQQEVQSDKPKEPEPTLSQEQQQQEQPQPNHDDGDSCWYVNLQTEQEWDAWRHTLLSIVRQQEQAESTTTARTDNDDEDHALALLLEQQENLWEQHQRIQERRRHWNRLQGMPRQWYRTLVSSTRTRTPAATTHKEEPTNETPIVVAEPLACAETNQATTMTTMTPWATRMVGGLVVVTAASAAAIASMMLLAHHKTQSRPTPERRHDA